MVKADSPNVTQLPGALRPCPGLYRDCFILCNCSVFYTSSLELKREETMQRINLTALFDDNLF